MVEGKKEFDATTAYNRLASFKYVVDISARLDGGVWRADATAKITTIEFKVAFDRVSSWVVKGGQAPSLLRHEALHLKLAEYIAQKAQANAPLLMGRGAATNVDKATASKNAGARALAEMVSRYDAYISVWAKVESVVQREYDRQTDHNRREREQNEWERHWRKLVDPILLDRGWQK